MRDLKAYTLGLTELALWREGNRAVVAIKYCETWFRVLEADDVRGNFFESVDADKIKTLFWASQLRRKPGPRPRPTRRLALAAE